MTEQKAFYEIEQLPRITYMVLVQPNGDLSDLEARCAACDAADKDDKDDGDDSDSEEVYLCDVCGGWYCSDHFHMKADLCLDCVDLSLAIRTEVVAFRQRLNALR